VKRFVGAADMRRRAAQTSIAGWQFIWRPMSPITQRRSHGKAAVRFGCFNGLHRSSLPFA
jgi:hypothetical protein